MLSEDNLDTAVAHLQSTIIAAAKATFGTPKPRLSPRPAPPPWFDNECRTARKLYRRADKSLGATPTATRLRAAYKKLCRSKKATYIAAESDRLLEQARTDPHTFYKNLCPRVTAPTLPPADSLFEHFENLLTQLPPPAPVPPPSPTDSTTTNTDTSSDYVDPRPTPSPEPDFWTTTAVIAPEQAESLTRDFTTEEVLAGVARLRNHRTADHHGIKAEFLKAAPEELAPLLVTLVNRLFHSAFPPDLARASLVPILKKGDPKEPGNCRGIAIITIISKLYAILLASRLTAVCEAAGCRASSQAGFRPRHSTTGNIWLLNDTIRRARTAHKRVFACFVDFF